MSLECFTSTILPPLTLKMAFTTNGIDELKRINVIIIGQWSVAHSNLQRLVANGYRIAVHQPYQILLHSIFAQFGFIFVACSFHFRFCNIKLNVKRRYDISLVETREFTLWDYSFIQLRFGQWCPADDCIFFAGIFAGDEQIALLTINLNGNYAKLSSINFFAVLV